MFVDKPMRLIRRASIDGLAIPVNRYEDQRPQILGSQARVGELPADDLFSHVLSPQ